MTTTEESWEGTVGVRRLDRRVLEVTGDEARSWLQGQVTGDVSGTRADAATYTLFVSSKGKILADAWVVARGEGLAMTVPAERADALLAHLDRYIVMEDVEVEATGEAVLTAQGPAARAAVDAAGLQGRAFEADHLGIGGLDLVVPAEGADGALSALRAAAEARGGGAIDDASWAAAHIRRARPRYGVDFDDGHYPQEAGLRERAVSFTKGCYLGQEVVCMLENRGQLRRHLVQLASDATLTPGATLRDEGQEVGRITSVAPSDGGSVALGYVKRARSEGGTVLDADGVAARVVTVAG